MRFSYLHIGERGGYLLISLWARSVPSRWVQPYIRRFRSAREEPSNTEDVNYLSIYRNRRLWMKHMLLGRQRRKSSERKRRRESLTKRVMYLWRLWHEQWGVRGHRLVKRAACRSPVPKTSSYEMSTQFFSYAITCIRGKIELEDRRLKR